MSDALNGVLAEREALETGFSKSLAVSLGGHGLLLLLGVGLPLLLPHAPRLHVQEGFTVALPRGGGGVRTTEAPAPPPAAAQPQPAREEPVAAPQPPPKILKPPKPEPPRRGLPELTSKPARKPVKATPPPVRGAAAPGGVPGGRGAVPGGTGTSSATPGVEFGPPGPGVPGGSDLGGDWYLAGVQRKIWLVWMQQLQSGFTGSIRVSFTILADGSVEGVRVLEPSTVAQFNLAAQRAVVSAAPFSPLPRTYGTNRFTIQVIFKPTP
jgi:TonB family protein